MADELKREYNLFSSYAVGEMIGCPFCKSDDITVELKYRIGGAWMASYSARCGNCEARGPEKDNPYDAEEGWNERGS